MKTNVLNPEGGFSFTQVLIAVAIIGVIATVSFRIMSDTPQRVEEAKLRSHVATLNSAVQAYRSFGGTIPADATAEQIIAKLKSKADVTSSQQTAGLTGSLIDRGLTIEKVTGGEANKGILRTVWSAEKGCFVLRTEGDGIVAIDLDADLAKAPAQFESRESNLKLAVNDTWVWDYEDVEAEGSSVPTAVPTSALPGGQGGGGGGVIPPGGGGGSGGGIIPPGGGGDGGTGDPALALDMPLFSILSGTYPIAQFNLSLTLTNPNDGNVSRIQYKVDGGEWEVYEEGDAIAVKPDSVVFAYVESIDAGWTDSEQGQEVYLAEKIQLVEPWITNNNGHGNNLDGVDASNPGSAPFEDSDPTVDDEEKWVLVEVGHVNDESYSQLEYAINGGDWMVYVEPFLVLQSNYPNGVVVKAKAKGTKFVGHVMDSDEERARLEWLDPVLDPPGILLSAGQFNYGDAAEVTVTILNSNDTSDSAIQYRVGESAWTDYEGPVTLSVSDYQNTAAHIEAKSVGTRTYLIDGQVFSYPDSLSSEAIVFPPDPLFTISGLTSAAFTNEIGTVSMVTSASSAGQSTLFSWGDGSGDEGDTSYLLFNSNTFSDVSTGEQFLAGTLEYYNGTAASGSELDAVQLLLDLAFSDGAGSGVFQFTLELMNEVDVVTGTTGGSLANLEELSSDNTVTILDDQYALDLSLQNFTVDGAAADDGSYLVLEGQSGTGDLFGILWIQDDTL